MELRHAALQAFAMDSPTDKVAAVHALARQHPPVDTATQLRGPAAPGRPARPALVEPQQVARRSPYTPAGHAALMHAIAHIEFNAINLALDAVWRFADLPEAYYRDWLQVAAEEAKHFHLLVTHLQQCGYDYGSFEAHDGLWTMCDNTRADVVARMALVPRTLEARGLDATPIIQAKLRKVGSAQALAACTILDTILAEEVGHVAIGNQWYHWLCERAGLESGAFYAQAALRYAAPRPKPPFNLEARRAAGFTDAELEALETGVAAPAQA
jgi:uncharacterized ferritin-like protein (DUF455 family)